MENWAFLCLKGEMEESMEKRKTCVVFRNGHRKYASSLRVPR